LSLGLREYSTRIVGLLIIVMAVSVYFLWELNPVNQAGEAVFAIFLAVDLVSFMMISYIYRTYKYGEQFNRALLIGACCMIIILVYASLAL
jgi:predicted membrane channel-forming protein YqfA (hemolysin III family)